MLTYVSYEATTLKYIKSCRFYPYQNYADMDYILQDC